MNNPIFEKLCKLQICEIDKTEHIQSFVRDRNDINVFECLKTGAMFLDSCEHMSLVHYDSKPPTHKNGSQQRQIISTNDDTLRRYNSFKNLVRNRRWLDIGTGSGAILDVLSPLASQSAAVEPQKEASNFLKEMGYGVYRRLDDVPAESFDIATLFHVFEHLVDPFEALQQISSLLVTGGDLIVEVPHARDLLIKSSEAFRAHTFWSEHLFLHTRETITALLQHGGFEIKAIKGVQRYPLANHLYWLSHGKPRGQIEWAHFVNEHLDANYESTLASNDVTDTLVVYAKKAI